LGEEAPVLALKGEGRKGGARKFERGVMKELECERRGKLNASTKR
jgi:hypothetical protein